MLNYDFLILSQDEFERFSRDLLQEILSIKFESFTSGKDDGIDFRCCANSERIILQCKRYSSYNNLLSNLKKEAKKVIKHKPSRYIITTSVGLTPKNKNDILEIFDGYIKETSDIFGKDDLNNYLNTLPDIEKKYYKLWLSSTNILEKIINSKIINQTEIEKENIKKNLQLYVQNNSFVDAMEILQNQRFVLISGIPGIGKTTLARFLVYYLLGNGMEEFIFLSDSINDAFQTLNINKKQVFLFDDFLGKRNFTKSSLMTNEDRRIIDFIDLIHNSRNKYLIFTTREYILRQAKFELENFNELGEEIKCIIDLEKYTRISRARILYNHLFFYSLPKEYILSVLKNNLYIKLIDHRNYSPRLIESLTKKKIWKNIKPEKYGENVLKYFDNPEILWEHAYENQITELSRCLLAILTTTDVPIFLTDLELALQNFFKEYEKKYTKYSYFEFQKSLKELEDTFIVAQKDNNENIIINFQNPSIHDFLCNYLNKNRQLLNDVIESSIFFNQLVVSFTKRKNDFSMIHLDKNIEKIIINKILKEYDFMNISVLETIRKNNYREIYYRKVNNSDIYKIGYIIDRLSVREYKKLKSFLKNKINSINIESLHDDEIDDYLKTIDLIKEEINDDKYIRESVMEVFKTISNVSELDYFSRVKSIDDEYFETLVLDEDFRSRIINICETEYENCPKDDLEDFKYQLDEMSDTYSIPFDNLIMDVDDKIEEYNAEISEYYTSDDYRNLNENNEIDKDIELKNMFESLLTE